MAESSADQKTFQIILFYRYVQFSDVETVARLLQAAMDSVEGLSGRILLAEEGINGNLAAPEASMQEFIAKLLDVEELGLSEEEVKSSKTVASADPFPDLRLRRVKHLISGGEALDSIPIEETAQGYLSPADWLHAAREGDSVLIDVRNARETAIGHFEGALDPKTKHFSEFSRWLDSHQTQEKLRDKRVLMYCTGGVRCEKASALLRRKQIAKSVEHLQGGIHRFQEKLGDADGFWKGKMFVFDRRGAMKTNEFDGSDNLDNPEGRGALQSSSGTEQEERQSIVGKCLYCGKAHDVFHPDAVCVVCREPCLVCDDCRELLNGEYHCETHAYLKDMYFGNLERFNDEALCDQNQQLQGELNKIMKGKEHRNKRRTIGRQIARVNELLQRRSRENEELHADRSAEVSDRKRRRLATDLSRKCRSCGDLQCNGDCWGFWGTKRASKQPGR